MRRLFTWFFFLTGLYTSAYAANIKITDDGSYSMDNNWLTKVKSMGHTAYIVPQSMLNDTTFFDTTDVLIISNGLGTYSATQVTTIQRFLRSGKSVYFQAEYSTAYSSNQSCSDIVTALGGTFSWTGTVSGDLDPDVIGSLSNQDSTVPALTFFYYGATGNTSCNVLTFLVANSGESVGWMFRPTTKTYGRMIFTTDQDWVNSATGDALAQNLMGNIVRHLVDTSFGDKTQKIKAVITSSVDDVCPGTAITFKARSIYAVPSTELTYQWKRNTTNVGTDSTYTSSAIANGDSVVCVVTTSSGCSATGSGKKIMTIKPAPAAPAVSSPVRLCKDATATALTATASSASDTLKWYNVATGGTPLGAAPVPVTTTTGTTNYYVSQKGTIGCESSRATIAVNILKPVRPTVSSPVNLCKDAVATALTATASSASDTLKWYTTDTGTIALAAAPVPVTSATGTTTYYVSQKNNIGCEGDKDSIKVVVNAVPTVPTVTTPVVYCRAAAATALTATASSASDTLLWYTAATGGSGSKTAPTPVTTTTGTTNHYVSQRNTLGCESSRATLAVNVVIAATPTVTTPVTYCIDATASALTATKGASTDTLLWYTVPSGGTASKTAPTPVTSATGSTSFYVSAKTATSNCEGSRATITVIVNDRPSIPTVTTPVIYCQGATAVPLTASTGATTDTLLWYTAATGGTGDKTAPTPSTSSAGTTARYVSAKNTLSCESITRALINVTINPRGANPTVTTPVNYCIGATASPLTATKGSSTDTLLWYTTSTGGVPSYTAPTPLTTPTGSTSYYVSAKTNLGCEGNRTTLTVTIRPLAATPTVTTPVTYCQYINSVALTATPGAGSDTLLWYTAATGGTGTKVAPTPPTDVPGSTTWYVSGKTSFNCEGSRTPITVNVNPQPSVDVISTAATGIFVCRGGDPVTLKSIAPTAITYQWYYMDTLLTTATEDTVAAGKTGFWYALVTDDKGCENKDSLWIQIDTTIEPVLTPAYSKICRGSSAYLTCHPGIVTHRFKWFHNGTQIDTIPATNHIANVNQAGAYTVEATNAVGCTYTTDTVTVDFYPATPKPVIINTFPTLAFSGSGYMAQQWYRDGIFIPGASGKTITVKSDGKYYVVVTDAYGCKVHSDTVEIQGMGINEEPIQVDIRVFPNPSQGKIVIESPVDVQATLTDINGRILIQKETRKELDLGAFADGLYLLYIRDAQGNMLHIERVSKSSVQY